MKTIWSLALLICASVGHANELNIERFNASYQLEKISGYSNYYRSTGCSGYTQIDENTIDARNVECEYEEVEEDLTKYCPDRIEIRSEEDRIYVDGMSDNLGNKYYLSEGLKDQNYHQGSCEDMDGISGAIGCMIINLTGFLHEERKLVSEENSVSSYYNTRENGENEFIKISRKDKDAKKLTIKRKGVERVAGPKFRNHKREQWNFKCSYTKL